MKNIKLILILLVIAAIVIIFSLFKLYQSYDKVSSNYGSIQNKYDFTISSHSLLEHIKDAESAKRGFLLTGNKMFLENYYKSSFRIDIEKERFKRIIDFKKLNNADKKDILVLLSLIDLKSKQLKNIIDLKLNGQSDVAVEKLNSYSAKNILDSLENTIRKINYQKKYEEIKEKKIIASTRRKTRFILFICNLMVLKLLVIIGIIITRKNAG